MNSVINVDQIIVHPQLQSQIELDGTILLFKRDELIAKLSPEDSDLAALNWRKSEGYTVRSIRRNNKNANELMHRVILSRLLGRELNDWEMVDHIEGITYDNRREKIRLATNSQNQQNRQISQNNLWGFKGVTFHRKRQHWRANIGVGGTTITIGSFDKADQAAYAYDRAALAYFGEFARLNFPKEIYVGLPMYQPSDYTPKVTSQYRGVSWVSAERKWKAAAFFNGRKHQAGAFRNEDEAARAYDRLIIENNLPLDRLNFPLGLGKDQK